MGENHATASYSEFAEFGLLEDVEVDEFLEAYDATHFDLKDVDGLLEHELLRDQNN
ncbi:hypothetical protein [Haladaptatus halobius]|uniref:hypothetical protein n=1 Tax=Haladaptatus halobius TaxID=2884875 RepID=UPI001D0A478C|nr:hypothetical protein [Haladaptatus halobius]